MSSSEGAEAAEERSCISADAADYCIVASVKVEVTV